MLILVGRPSGWLCGTTLLAACASIAACGPREDASPFLTDGEAISPSLAPTPLAERADVLHSPPALLVANEPTMVTVWITCPLSVSDDVDATSCVRSAVLDLPSGSLTLEWSSTAGWTTFLRAGTDVGDFVRYRLRVTFVDGSELLAPADEVLYEVPITRDEPIIVLLPAARSVPITGYSELLASARWGDGTDEVGFFEEPEGSSGGPSGFAILPSGDVLIMDYIGRRTLRFSGGRFVSSEASCVGTLVYDTERAVGFIVESEKMVCVLDRDGAVVERLAPSTGSVASLDPGNLAAADGILWARDRSGSWVPVLPRLADVGRGQEPFFGGLNDVSEVDVAVEVRGVDLKVMAGGLSWVVRGDFPITLVSAARALDDGRTVLVATDASASPERPVAWILQLDATGLHAAQQIELRSPRMVNGPEIIIRQGSVDVLSTTDQEVLVRRFLI